MPDTQKIKKPDLSEENISCAWCGRAYSEHDDERAENMPVPRTPCLLLKSRFWERK